MMKLLTRKENPARSKLNFTIRGQLEVRGQRVTQTVCATEHYVVTQIDRTATLFWSAKQERFLVDWGARQLKRLDLAPQIAQVEQLRGLIGEIGVEADEDYVEVSGRRCRRYTVHNQNAHIVVSGEAFATKVPGLERTALSAERALDARLQPFSLPLDADEVVVRSSMRTIANQFEQQQNFVLDDLSPDVLEQSDFDELLGFTIVG